MKGEEKPSLNSKIFTKKVNRIVKIKEDKNMNNVQNEAPKETEEENLKSQKTVSKKMGKIVAFIGTLVMVLFCLPQVRCFRTMCTNRKSKNGTSTGKGIRLQQKLFQWGGEDLIHAILIMVRQNRK